jgi:hypothetical protein
MDTAQAELIRASEEMKKAKKALDATENACKARLSRLQKIEQQLIAEYKAAVGSAKKWKEVASSSLLVEGVAQAHYDTQSNKADAATELASCEAKVRGCQSALDNAAAGYTAQRDGIAQNNAADRYQAKQAQRRWSRQGRAPASALGRRHHKCHNSPGCVHSCLRSQRMCDTCTAENLTSVCGVETCGFPRARGSRYCVGCGEKRVTICKTGRCEIRIAHGERCIKHGPCQWDMHLCAVISCINAIEGAPARGKMCVWCKEANIRVI